MVVKKNKVTVAVMKKMMHWQFMTWFGLSGMEQG